MLLSTAVLSFGADGVKSMSSAIVLTLAVETFGFPATSFDAPPAALAVVETFSFFRDRVTTGENTEIPFAAFFSSTTAGSCETLSSPQLLADNIVVAGTSVNVAGGGDGGGGGAAAAVEDKSPLVASSSVSGTEEDCSPSN